MSLFGSLMADVEDDPFFGSHMRHMRQMNNMMNSMFSDPFGMLSGGLGGPLAIAGPRHGSSLMPFMPQMPSLNRLFSVDMDGGMGHASSFSSSTVVMSSGPNGKPQVYSSSSSTKIGPNGVKETRKTLQDSRTGTKKMSIGHHIGERAHLIEREQNYYSGDQEERQEFINLEEDEAEQFDREFQEKAGAYTAPSRARITDVPRRAEPLLALPAPPAPRRNESFHPKTDLSSAIQVKPYPESKHSSGRDSERRPSSVSSSHRPSARRPLRTSACPLTITVPNSSASVREVYSGAHPQRLRHKHHHKANRHAQNDH